MRFSLVDRIVDLKPDESITAVKALSLAEEYLADHFPLFPIMPGVLMLEAMTQTCAWLVRASDDFAHSMVTLAEGRNVKYTDFVQPGQTLIVTAGVVKREGRRTKFKVRGEVDGKTATSAVLTLVSANLADDDPDDAPMDEYARQMMRKLFDVLYRTEPEAGGPAAAVVEQSAAGNLAKTDLAGS